VLPSPFGPRYHSQHPIISIPTIYTSSPLCYHPILEPDITLRTLLLVSPQYTVLHPCVTFPFLPQITLTAPYYESPHNIYFLTPVLPSPFGPGYHSQHPIISLPTIYSSSPLCYLPLLYPDITLSTLWSVSPQYTFLHPSVTFLLLAPDITLSTLLWVSHNIQFFTPLLPSPLAPDITLSTLLWVSPQYTVLHSCVTFPFGTRYHSQHTIMSLPTIYSSSFLCYLPTLSPEITLSTLLSVSPQYTFLHPCVTFTFWPQISLSAPFYQSPHNIYFFTPRYLPILTPDITLSTLLWLSPQYTVLHLYVTISFWPQISLSAPYYESPHNIHFFTPVLPSNLAPDITLSTLLSVSPQYRVFHPSVTFPFGPRYQSLHPNMSLPTIYGTSPLGYLPLLTSDITLSTQLWVSQQYTVLHPCVTFPF